MAEIRPFIALRYNTSAAGPASDLLSPPYDVVSAEDKAALYRRSPYNIAHVDFGEELEDDVEASSRYTRARQHIDEWLASGVLQRDPEPRLYVYDQEFSLHGNRLRRRSVFCRLRLEEWDAGVILPHEQTLAGPKADRLKLLQATGVNLSPILAMYQNESGGLLIQDADVQAPLLDATMESGDRHVLSPMTDEAATRFVEAMKDRKLYVADGHHRYETALAYRDERRAAAQTWTGEEPENFVLAALVDARDPGLVVLPIHRIVPVPSPDDVIAKLGQHFDIEELTMRGDGGAIPELVRRLEDSGRSRTSIGIVGMTTRTLQLLKRQRFPRSREDLLPAGHAEVWRNLDVNVLHHIVFPTIGFSGDTESIEYTEDHEYAAMAAATRPGAAAFFLNPTRTEQIIACADAGERMPQKTTFFYPKLATGVVMYPLT